MNITRLLFTVQLKSIGFTSQRKENILCEHKYILSERFRLSKRCLKIECSKWKTASIVFVVNKSDFSSTAFVCSFRRQQQWKTCSSRPVQIIGNRFFFYFYTQNVVTCREKIVHKMIVHWILVSSREFLLSFIIIIFFPFKPINVLRELAVSCQTWRHLPNLFDHAHDV